MKKTILLLFFFGGLAIAAASAQNVNHLTFNAGGGFGGALGNVGKVTGKSYDGVAGVGWNFTRRLGVRAEYMYYNLSFKDSVKRDQSLPDASGRLQSATLNLFYQVPLQGKLGVYAIGGGGWYQRHVQARSETLDDGAVCQPAWQLWGIACDTNNRVHPSQVLSDHTVDGGGYNFGGGFTYRIAKRTRVYVEGRYHHVYTPDGHTNVFPVTVGLRW